MLRYIIMGFIKVPSFLKSFSTTRRRKYKTRRRKKNKTRTKRRQMRGG
jgi:hypothetical protein